MLLLLISKLLKFNKIIVLVEVKQCLFLKHNMGTGSIQYNLRPVSILLSSLNLLTSDRILM